jgi:hypothetical protein
MEAPVRKAAFWTIVLTLMGGHGFVHADEVRFKNELADCATIKLNTVSMTANIVLANTTVTLTKPIGACRCLSALATYTSSVDRGGVRQVLQEGLVSLKSGGNKRFVLATEPALIASKEVTVSLSCTGPL